MKTIDGFSEWMVLGGLAYRAGNYAVVDRGVLYPGEQWPISFDRWQVIDFSQKYCACFGLLDSAIAHAEDCLGNDLDAMRRRVVEQVLAAEMEPVLAG